MSDSVSDHAYEGYPSEVCGILVGKGGVASYHYRMSNRDMENKHFLMDTNELFVLMKQMQGEDLEMLAIYHSHPDAPARPTPDDILLALTPNISYVIVSLMKLDSPVLKSFRIAEGRAVQEEVEYL